MTNSLAIKLAEDPEEALHQKKWRSEQVDIFKNKLRSIVSHLGSLDVSTMTNEYLPFTENRNKVIHFMGLIGDASQLLNQAADELDGISKPHHLRPFEEKKMANSLTKTQLLKLAEDLEDPENETLVAAEKNDLLDKIAFSFMKAADALREAAEDMAAFEPAPEALTAQKLDEIAAVAEAFAESDDELLQKQAAVLDDFLITIASPTNAFLFSTADHDDRIEQLKKKYTETREKQQKDNKISEAVKEIEKSEVYKEYRVMEQPLSTRYCPDHAGQSTHRVGEHTVRCALDGKTYNWDEGFTTQKGNKVPGSTVQEQNANDQHNTFTTFDSRATRMGYNPEG